LVQDWGRNGLTGYAAIALIARAPLMAGSVYTITVSVEGERNPYPFDGPWNTLAGQIRTFTYANSEEQRRIVEHNRAFLSRMR
jgi:hypothetical protein